MSEMHVDKHYWAIKISWSDENWIESFSLYQLSELNNFEIVGHTHVKTIKLRTQNPNDGIQKLLKTLPSHYMKFKHENDEWRIYHNHQAILDMDDQDITYLKGYLYLVASKCHLWNFHDLLFVEVWGHGLNDEKPQIIKVKDVEDLLYHIPEITFGQEKYDVLAPIVIHRELFPDLGIDVVEMDKKYKNGEDFKGLFAFWVDKDGELYKHGFRECDVIKSITRLNTKKVYKTQCLEDLKFALEKITFPNEKIKIDFVRGEKEMSLTLNRIPFTERKFEHWQKLEKIRKAIFDIWLDIQLVKLGYPAIADDRMTDYKNIFFWVDENMDLHVKQPEATKHLDFNLNEITGNLEIWKGQN